MFTLILLEKIEKNVKLFLLRSHFTAFHALFSYIFDALVTGRI